MQPLLLPTVTLSPRQNARLDRMILDFRDLVLCNETDPRTVEPSKGERRELARELASYLDSIGYSPDRAAVAGQFAVWYTLDENHQAALGYVFTAARVIAKDEF